MSENLLIINILVIIFYVLIDKLKIDEELKKYALYPLRIILLILAIIDLLVLFKILAPFI